MKTSSKIVVAAAAGAVVGAAIAILFAPAKGSETRKKIKSEGKKLSEELKDLYTTGKEKINSLGEDLGQTIREKVEKFV